MPAEFPAGLDPYLWRPVISEIWSPRDFEVFDFHDLVEANRVLDWKEENQRLYAAAVDRNKPNR